MFLPSPRRSLIGEHDASTAHKLAMDIHRHMKQGELGALLVARLVLIAKGGDILLKHVSQIDPRLIASHRASRMGSLTLNFQLFTRAHLSIAEAVFLAEVYDANFVSKLAMDIYRQQIQGNTSALLVTKLVISATRGDILPKHVGHVNQRWEAFKKIRIVR